MTWRWGSWRSWGTFVVALQLTAGAWALACVGEDTKPDNTANPDATTPDSSIPNNGDAADPGTDAGVDAGSTPPRCKVDGEFGVPELVSGLSGQWNSFTGRVSGPRFYFVSDRHNPTSPGITTGETDLYRGAFATTGITSLERLTALSDVANEEVSPSETADGLALYFATGPNLLQRRLRYVTRQSPAAPYAQSDLQIVPTLVAGSTYESDPYIVGNQLYFVAASADDAGAVRSKPYQVTIAAGGPVTTTLLPIPGAFGDVDIRFPVMNKAETELYFSIPIVATNAQRPYVARRTSKAVPFGPPIELTLLSIKFVALPSSLSEDECDLYLSARDTTSYFDIYRASRPPP